MDPILTPHEVGISREDTHTWAQDMGEDLNDDNLVRDRVTSELEDRDLSSAGVRRAGVVTSLADILYDDLLSYRA